MKPFMKLFVKLKCSKQDRQWLGAIRRGVLDGGVNARLSRGDAMILGERRCHDPRTTSEKGGALNARPTSWYKSFLFCDSNHSCFVTQIILVL